MNDKEKLIVEKKTAEAQSKNLMGISGKPGIVMQMLGQPILMHCEGASFYAEGEDASFGYSQSQIYNYYDLPSAEDHLPTMGDTNGMPSGWEWSASPQHISDDEVIKIGYSFCGLSRGYNLSMKYLEEDHDISIHFNGYLVYQELEGELKCYVNGPWEDRVNELYNVAKNVLAERKISQLEEAKQEVRKNRMSWLDKMKRFWGI